MEEADVLCNRIAIVNNGVMSCLGSQNRLKDLYGGGYHLFINCLKADGNQQKTYSTLTAFVKKNLPKALLLR